MSRTEYNKLGYYNLHKPGTVQGPPVKPNTPPMYLQQVLTPPVKHARYNALTYGSTGQPYYNMSSGPYKGACSVNNPRPCWGYMHPGSRNRPPLN